MRNDSALPAAPAPFEDLAAGDRILRRTFLEQPYRSMRRHGLVIGADDPDPPVVLLQRGMAFRCNALPVGRRAILDLLLPGDVAGLELAVFGRAYHDLIAANAVGYRAIKPELLRALMTKRAAALQITALMAEARWRCDRHLTAIGRLDARERIGLFLLDIHDRLRRRDLIARPTFNLPLTQEQIADHLGITMVHVNRMLRRLRDEKLVLLTNQVVVITDIDRLRALVGGLPPFPTGTELPLEHAPERLM